MRIFTKKGQTMIYDNKMYNLMEISISSDYVKEIAGSLSILGVCNIYLFKDILKENEKPKRMVLTVPVRFTTAPARVRKEDNGKTTILTYYNEDIVVENIEYIKDVDNTAEIFNIMSTGKIKHIPYKMMLDMYIGSMELNNVGLKNPYMIYEIFVAESCRSVKDPSKPHRLDLSGEFTNFSTRSQALLTSGNFAANSFEDVDTAMINTLQSTKKGKGLDKDSPLYKTLFK